MMRFIFKAMVSLICLSVITTLWIINTERGTRWLIPHLLPANLEIKNIQGKLVGPLFLNKITLHSDTAESTIDALTIRWQPRALLHGEININELTADHLMVHQTASLATSQHKKPQQIPFNWLLGKITLANIIVYDTQNLPVLQLTNITAQGTLNAENIQLTTHWDNLVWKIDSQHQLYNDTGAAKINGAPKAYQLSSNFNFNIKGLTNKISSDPLQLNLAATIKDEHIYLQNFHLHSAAVNLNLQGNITNTWDLNWNIKIDNLSKLLPNARGTLSSVGAIKGLRQQPYILGTVSAKDIYYLNYQFQNLLFNIDANFQPQGKLAIKLAGRQLKLAKIAVNEILLTIDGTTAQHVINGTLATEKSAVKLQAQGHAQPLLLQWDGLLTQFSTTSTKMDTWSLKTPTPLLFSPTAISIQALCLQSARQAICIDGKWLERGDSRFAINIKALALGNLKFLLPPKTELQATLNATINLSSAQHKNWQGKAELHITPGWLDYTILQEKHRSHFEGGDLTAELTPELLTSQLKFNAAAQQNISAVLAIKNLLQADSQKMLNGQIKLYFTNLNLLPIVIPQITNPQGTFTANIALSGTVEKPVFEGQASLVNAKTEIIPLGITPNNINIAFNGHHAGELTFKGSALSGGGTLNFVGQTNLTAAENPFALSVTGNQFLISQTPEYIIYASPKLTLKKLKSNIQLTGELFIPKAQIKPLRYSQESVELTRDVQFVNKEGKAIDETPFGLDSDIYLTLGDQISVDYYGLTGGLSGALHIRDTPESTPTANGLLSLQGSYKAYGKKLQIQQGKLIFSGGDLANPSLDIEAEKTVTASTATTTSGLTDLTNAAALVGSSNKIIVGVNVQGTLQNRQITLFSKPPVLNQPDILSYIVLGRPAAQATKADAQLLYNAASALDLGGNQVGQLSKQVKSTLGLDEIDIGTMNTNAPQATATQNTSLILGKALSPKLYINYSIGLLQPVNTLRLRYFFTPRWILQSETNSIANAVDLFYTFDKN